jgi:hypothetical protein
MDQALPVFENAALPAVPFPGVAGSTQQTRPRDKVSLAGKTLYILL